MEAFRHTLVCDGPTDGNLVPILNWVLRQHAGLALSRGQVAEFWRLPRPPRSLEDRLRSAVELYPRRLLFVHRDAEKQPPRCRYKEIEIAFARISTDWVAKVPAVAVVPVRMLEAWLLLDENAIRRAAGDPNGRQPLDLPAPGPLEEQADPKEELKRALHVASGLRGRHLKKFHVGSAFWRITEYQGDFTALRQLPAFCRLEEAVDKMAKADFSPAYYGLTGD